MMTAEGRGDNPLPRRDIGIIVNPKHAVTSRAYSTLIAGLRDNRVHYRTMVTTKARSGRWQAEQLVDWGAEAVIILGGDGTLRSAAPVLAESGALTFLIPTGTVNVLSRHIGIGTPRQALAHCLRTLRSTADIGTSYRRSVPVNIADAHLADGSREQTHFLSLAGIGGDARAVAHHHAAPGLLGYAWGAARALFAPELTLHTGDTGRANDSGCPDDSGHIDESRSVWSIMASKAVRPAGPITVFPDADFDGEDFSVLTVGPLPAGALRRARAWTAIAVSCLQGHPDAHPLMHYRRATSVTVSLNESAPAQLDGDLIGDCLELRLSTGDSSLEVSAPAS
jgi:diacylglycerol kinase (ATP)